MMMRLTFWRAGELEELARHMPFGVERDDLGAERLGKAQRLGDGVLGRFGQVSRRSRVATWTAIHGSRARSATRLARAHQRLGDRRFVDADEDAVIRVGHGPGDGVARACERSSARRRGRRRRASPARASAVRLPLEKKFWMARAICVVDIDLALPQPLRSAPPAAGRSARSRRRAPAPCRASSRARARR